MSESPSLSHALWVETLIFPESLGGGTSVTEPFWVTDVGDDCGFQLLDAEVDVQLSRH